MNILKTHKYDLDHIYAHIFGLSIREYMRNDPEDKYPSDDPMLITYLLKKRKCMMQRITQLKQEYHQKTVNRSDFYPQYEALGQHIYRIDADINQIDPKYGENLETDF